MPPARTRAPALRDVREDRSDRGPGPRRPRRRMRELLPDAAGPLHRLRPAPGVQLRGGDRAGLQDVHPAGHGAPAPAAARTGRPPRGGPRARSATPAIPRAAPPRRLHGLRSAAAADRPARPRRDHVRGLRRAAAHPRTCAMRRRGQTVRERPLRTLQPARPSLGPAGRRGPGSDPGGLTAVAGAITRGPEPLLGPELAADQRVARQSSPIVAAGRAAATHQALDAHPDRRAADYLRHMLTAGGVLPAAGRGTGPRRAMASREVLERHQRNRATGGSSRPTRPGRSCSGCAAGPSTAAGPRTHTARRPAPGQAPWLGFLAWLRHHGTHPGRLRPGRHRRLARHRAGRLQRPRTSWPGPPPARHCPRAARSRGPPRQAGTAISPRPAMGTGRPGCSTTTTLAPHRPGRRLPAPAVRPAPVPDRRHDHRRGHHRDGQDVSVRLGRHEVPVPDPLGRLLLTADPRRQALHRHRLTDRLAGGCSPAAARPAPSPRPGSPSASAPSASPPRPDAGPHSPTSPPSCPPPSWPTSWACTPSTAVSWMHQAGGDWNRYAAQLAQTAITDHEE